MNDCFGGGKGRNDCQDMEVSAGGSSSVDPVEDSDSFTPKRVCRAEPLPTAEPFVKEVKCSECGHVTQVEFGLEVNQNYSPPATDQNHSPGASSLTLIPEEQGGTEPNGTDAREELKRIVPPEQREYIESFMKKKSIQPNELLDLWTRLTKTSPRDDYQLQARCYDDEQRNPQQPESGGSGMPSMPRIWIPRVKVCCVATGKTFGAHEAILDCVKDKYVSEVILTNNKHCDLVLVFCPVTSRAGSDVAAAMRNPEVSGSSKPIILVVLHHTRDPDYSTAGRKCSEEFPRVKFEAHVLFHETQPGLLNCLRNDQAISNIKKEVWHYSKYRR